MQVTKRRAANNRERGRIGTNITGRTWWRREVLFSFSSLPGLVEEDVPWLGVLGDVWGKPVKLLDGLGVNFLYKHEERWCLPGKNNDIKRKKWDEWRTHLHDVVIKQQPEAVTLHDGDVMTPIGATEGTNSDCLLHTTPTMHCIPCNRLHEVICSLINITVCNKNVHFFYLILLDRVLFLSFFAHGSWFWP